MGKGGEGGRGGTGGIGAAGEQGPPGERGEPGREGLPAWWKMALTLWIIIFTIMVIWGYALNSTSRKALCDQRNDLDIRIARTQALLDHSEGKHTVFGFPRNLLVESQKQNKTTRENLAGLDDAWWEVDCDPSGH